MRFQQFKAQSFCKLSSQNRRARGAVRTLASSSPFPRNSTKTPRAIYFTGGGNFYYWQCGAAMYLKDTFDMTDDSLSMIGASAGSITATLLKLDADFNRSIDHAIELAEKSRLYERKAELALVWGPLIRQWLQEVLPDSIEQDTCNGLHVTVTPALPIKPPKLVSDFRSKEDVIEAVMASIHVPIFLDGKPWTRCRGEIVLDGSFWWFITRDFNQKTCPLPAHISREDLFIVDWREDIPHREKLKKEILGGPAFRVLKPNFVYEMVEAGYLFMKKQHNKGNLPWENSDKSFMM